MDFANIAQTFRTQTRLSPRRECSPMRRSHEPPVHRFDIDHGVNDAMPPRRHSNPQECAPGYLWNSTTQELIPILPEDHPDYRQNEEIIAAAIRRWNGAR
jgi:hypothetical protein